MIDERVELVYQIGEFSPRLLWVIGGRIHVDFGGIGGECHEAGPFSSTSITAFASAGVAL